MKIQDIELVKFRLRRKLDRTKKRELRNCYINWEHEENLLNDESYQNCKRIQKEIETIIE